MTTDFSSCTLLSSPRTARSISLDDVIPTDTDYIGMWYAARQKQGISDRILFATYDHKVASLRWFHASHQYRDGIGAVGEKLAPLFGSSPSDTLPQGRDLKAPGFINYWRASRQPLSAPKANMKWRQLAEEYKHKDTPFPACCLLNQTDTQQIDDCARLAGVSTSVWLLWTADRVLRHFLLHPDAVSSWVYPVNLRGATHCKRASMNQCGGFVVTVSASMTALDLHEQIKARLSRKEHWWQWWLMSIGRLLGQSGVDLVYRCLKLPSGKFAGSYSNLGQWQIPDLAGFSVSAPCSPAYPVSVGTAHCNGRRGLAIRTHPVVNQDDKLTSRILNTWRHLLLGWPLQAGQRKHHLPADGFAKDD